MMNNSNNQTIEITFNSLYKEHFSTVCKYAKNKLKNHENNVEDVANEAFLILWQCWDHFEPKTLPALMAYLFTTATHITYNNNRKAQKLPTIPFDDALGHEERENGITTFTFHEHLKHIRAALSEEEYLLFEQKVIYCEEPKEIAAYWGISENTLKMRWHRLRIKIQKIY